MAVKRARVGKRYTIPIHPWGKGDTVEAKCQQVLTAQAVLTDDNGNIHIRSFAVMEEAKNASSKD